MLCPHSEHDGEILFFITVWTLLSLFGAWWGDSLTRHHAPNNDEMSSLGRVSEFPHHAPNDERAWLGDSLTRLRLDISHRRSSHGWQMPHYATNDDEICPAWGK